MARVQMIALIVICHTLSLFTLTDSLGTYYGHRKIHERQRRAAAGYPVANGPQARYQQGYAANQNSYQQGNYQNPQQANYPQNQQQSYGQSAVPYQVQSAATPQYVGYINPTAIASVNNGYRQNPQSSLNPAYSASSVYGTNPQYPGTQQGYNVPPTQAGNQQGYNVQPTQASYPAMNNNPVTAGYSYPNGAYPMAQNAYPAVAGQNGYPAYQGAASNPQMYNFNGYNPYGNQQMGYGNNGGYGQGRAGVAAVAPAPAPLVVAAPSPDQFTLVEFCKQKDREPKCTKNSFGMCDSQENYPSEVANEFYGYFKSRIIAMATDFDYSNSDQYDTGFPTQQNKLFDFVHEIFADDEFGSLPGVPPVKKGLCVENSDISLPGWAKTSRGKWTVIMNSNNIKQSVRAGMCKNAGKGCNSVPKCYKSECRQRFRYDTLLVFDPCDAKKPPMLELFKIPDGCECFVLQEEPDLQASISSPTPAGDAAVTEQQTTKPSAKGRSGDFAAAALLKAVNEAGTSTRASTSTTSTVVPSAAPQPTTPLPTTVKTTLEPTTVATTIPTTILATTTTTASTTTSSTTITAASSTTEVSAGIPPRSSLILSPRVAGSIPGSSAITADLQAL